MSHRSWLAKWFAACRTRTARLAGACLLLVTVVDLSCLLTVGSYRPALFADDDCDEEADDDMIVQERTTSDGQTCAKHSPRPLTFHGITYPSAISAHSTLPATDAAGLCGCEHHARNGIGTPLRC